jgi:hypothetical protein
MLTVMAMDIDDSLANAMRCAGDICTSLIAVSHRDVVPFFDSNAQGIIREVYITGGFGHQQVCDRPPLRLRKLAPLAHVFVHFCTHMIELTSA